MKWLPANLKGFLGILTLIFVFGWLIAVTFLPVKVDKDILAQILIAIVAFGKDIYNYFFGSTQGSAKKDEMIASMTTNPVAQTTTGDINLSKETPVEFKIEPEN